MSRVTLKEFSQLVNNLRIQAQGADTFKSKYKDTQLTGENKPAGYADDEEFTRLLKVGPVLDELIEGLEAVEGEIEEIHKYIEGQLGRDADKMILPPNLTFTDSLGNQYNIVTFNEQTGETQVRADEVFVGANSLYVNDKKVIEDDSDTINITTDPDQNLKVKTSESGILQLTSEEGGIQFISSGNTTFNTDVTVNSSNTISGSNASTGLQLGKTKINADLIMSGDIILSGQNKIAFGGDNTNSFIAANTDSPEDVEVHADQDVILRPDRNVVVGSTNVIDREGNWIGNPTGLKGADGSSGTDGTDGSSGSSGTDGTDGSSGSSGSSGTDGTSGTSGTSGTDGSSGSSGVDGTGFNTISNPGNNRVITSDGSTNSANAESNITFDGNDLTVNGNIILPSGSSFIGHSSSQSSPNIEFEGGGIEITGGPVLIGSGSPSGSNGDLTISGDLDVTGAIKGIKGDGSGLTNVDAETLDGLNSSQFLRSDTSDEMNGSLTVTGRLGASRLVLDNSESTSYTTENGLIIYDQAGNNSLIVYNSTLGRWVQIWDDSNHGAGSGLDADLLDGQHGSHYLNYNNFTNTPSINNDTITINAGNDLTGGGSFTLNQSSNQSITIDHANTSNQGSSTNSGRTYIQSISLDSNGHVTSLSTGTETVTNTNDIDYIESVSFNGGVLNFTGIGNAFGGEVDLSSLLDDTNNFVNSVSFNDGNGILTLGRSGLSNLTVDLDGRYNRVIGTDSDINTSGSTIVDNIFVTDGVITSMGTRNLTLSDLGYTGAIDADNYGGWILSINDGVVSAIESGNTLNFRAGSNVSLAYDPNDNTININSTDTNTVPNNNTITINAGNDLSGGGSFTLDQSFNETVTINHGNTSDLSGSYGSTSNSTKIDEITVDSNGHVTSITTGPTGDIFGITAGNGLTGGGSSGTVTINHEDTSDQSSSNNSGGVVIQDVTLDTFGHVTGLGTVNLDGRYFTEAQADSRYLNVSGDTMSGDINLNGNRLTNVDDIFVQDKIYHDGDTNTFIQFAGDRIEFDTGDGERMEINDSIIEMYRRLDMNNNDIRGVDQILHHGDTNTYIQFHASDQWRVVTGGSQRLEVNNSNVQINGGNLVLDQSLLSSQQNTNVDTGTETIAQISDSYDAAFFDFVIKNGTNLRAGTVYAVHDGTDVEFTETSTQDLGNTEEVELSVDLSGGNIRLRATTGSNNWTVKSLVRGL